MANEISCLNCKHSLRKAKKVWRLSGLLRGNTELICPNCGQRYRIEIKNSGAYYFMDFLIFLLLGLLIPKELPYRVVLQVFLTVAVIEMITYLGAVQLLEMPFFKNMFTLKMKEDKVE